MTLSDRTINEVRALLQREGVERLQVDDLSEDDLPGLGWSGSRLHVVHVGEALKRVALGEVEFVAVRAPDGSAVSMGGIDYVARAGVGTIWMLATAPVLQSLGIGSYLVSAAERRIHKRGRDVAELSVEDNNPQARALYERLGYQAVRRESPSWTVEGADGRETLYETETTVLRKRLLPSRLIWFFGPSAAGKETLIRDVASDSKHPIRKQLALQGRVEICVESLDKEVARERIPGVIGRWRSGDALLVKGQSRDIWDLGGQPLELPRLIAKKHPQFRQEVVFVWADPRELARRCENRSRRDEESGDAEGAAFWSRYSVEGCAAEHELQRKWVEALGRPILWVKNEGASLAIGDPPPTRPDR